MEQTHFVKNAAALAVALGALGQPAWAVTNINTCRTITESGSFQLTKNLNAAGSCIVIAANDVSLDLRGHTISGNGTGTGIGVNTDAERARVRVRNGVVNGFKVGVDLDEGFGGVIEEMRIGDNSMELGILAGDFAIVRDNIVLVGGGGLGASDGIRTRAAGLATGNVVFGGELSVICPALVSGNSVRSGGRGDIVARGQGCVLSNNRGIEVVLN